MIQSHSIGGPPAKGGGGDNSGKESGDRQNSRPAAPSRVEKGDSRVHRHDARDGVASGGPRDWRRPSKFSHEPYRRDDRVSRERWRDRKRWEKPRVREPSGDQPRGLMPHQHWQRDAPADFGKESSSSAIIDEFRDPFRGGSHAAKDPTRNPDGTAASISRSRLPYDDRGTEDMYNGSSSSQRAPSVTKRSGMPLQDASRESRSEGPKQPKRFLKRPGDKFRDMLNGTDKQQKPKEIKSEAAPRSSEAKKPSESHSGSTSNRTAPQETASDREATKSPIRSSQNGPIPTTSDVEASKLPASPSAVDDIKRSQDAAADPVQRNVDAVEAETREVHNGPSNGPSNGSVNGSVTGPANGPHTGPAHESSTSTGNANGESTSKADVLEHGLKDPSEEAAVNPTESAKDESLMEVCVEKSESPSVTTSAAIADELAPYHDNQARKLPQEIELHNRLVADLSKMSEGLPAATSYLTKQWDLPNPTVRVVAKIYEQQNEMARTHQERREQFLEHQQRWLGQLSHLEKETDHEPEATQAAVKPRVAGNHSRKRSRDEDAATNQKAHRRSRDRHNRGHGDVARSEAEFLEILANLEAQTARDPLVRARLTSARIPNQSQNPDATKFRSTNALIIDHSLILRRLEVDGVDNFTDAEHARFVEAYVQWPKQFGRIGDAVGRSFNDCVMHYYRTKKQENYKQILLQRSKKRRGRKPRKRTDEDSVPSTPTAPSTPNLTQDEVPMTPETVKINGRDSTSPRAGTETPKKVAIVAPTPSVSAMDVEPANDVPTPVVPTPVVPTPVELAAPETSVPRMVTSTIPEAPLGLLLNANADSSSGKQISTSNESRVVPPPVLPLHQMDALASAALDKLEWDTERVELFERLLNALGLDFGKIAVNMGIDPHQVQLFFERNREKYQQSSDGASPYVVTTNGSALPVNSERSAVAPNSMNGMANHFGSSEIDSPAQLSLPPVVQPTQALENEGGRPIPPPVLPLDAMNQSGSRQAGVPKPSHELPRGALVQPQDSVASAETPPQKPHTLPAMLTPFELPPLVTVIPPVLPRADVNGGIKRANHAYNTFAGQQFEGFMESNERH